MKKRLISFVLTLCMLLSLAPLGVFAAEYEFFDKDSGLKFTVTANPVQGKNGKVTVIENGYTETSYIIPATVMHNDKKYDVISVFSNAFKNCTSLTSVTLPKSLTYIGYCAFQGCTALKSIEIPGGVTRIEDEAFQYCNMLSSVTFAANSKLTYIGASSFYGCFSDNDKQGCSIVIPNGVTAIDTGAFAVCTFLTSVTLPDSLIEIGDLAFNSLQSMHYIRIPKSVKKIHDFAFFNCGRNKYGDYDGDVFYVEFETGTNDSLTTVEKSSEGLITGYAFPDYTKFIVDGGSLNAPDIGPCTNAAGVNVYMTAATLGTASGSKRTMADIDALLDDKGEIISYNLTDTHTDPDGKLYLWLPAGTKLGAVRVKDNADGSLTTTYNCTNTGGSLTVAENNNNAGSFFTDEEIYKIKTETVFTEGTEPTDSVVLRTVNYNNEYITAGSGKCGLRVENMPAGYSLVGLYTTPKIGDAEIQSVFTFTKAGSDNYDIYRFTPTRDTTLYAVVAQSGKTAVPMTICNESLPDGKAGELYGFNVNVLGSGAKVTVSGLPAGVRYDSTLNICSGTPQCGGNYKVTITLSRDGSEPVSKTFPVFIDGELLTVFGGMGDTPFTFYKDQPANPFAFEVDFPSADISTAKWSADGLPDGLSLKKDDTDAKKVTVTGTPTTLSGVSDARIIVDVTDTNGKKYRGELAIKVKVEEPYADVKTIVESAICKVPMTTANTETEVLDWLNDTWLPALISGKRLHEYEKNAVIRVNANATPFTAAVAGTSADADGTDGSLYFEIGTIADSSQSFTVLTTGICKIEASAYSHTHDWSEEWTADIAAHWHECGAADCNVTSNADKYGYAAHSFNTVWSSDGTHHWHECTVCGYKKDNAAHTAGVAATETTPQKCTVCDYILVPATGHIKHTLTFVPEKEATCTEEGIKAHYICSGCGKLFSDVAGEEKITDRDSVIISMTPHEVSREWSSDENSHWKICGKCNGKIYEAAHLYSADCDSQCNECGCHRSSNGIKKHHCLADFQNDKLTHWLICDKCDERYSLDAHKYDSDTDAECDICKYKRTILTAVNPGGGDIFFTPGDGVTLPDRAGIVTEPYTPAQGDLEAVGGALGGLLLQKTEYTVDSGDIRVFEPNKDGIGWMKSEIKIGDIVEKDGERYVVYNSKNVELISLKTGQNIELSTLTNFYQDWSEVNTIQSIKYGTLTELSDIQITINGAEYVTKYSYVSDDLKAVTDYILYTPSGAPVGVLSVNEDGSTSLRCNSGYDPESLKDTQTPSAGTIGLGGKNYSMIPLMLNDIKIKDGSGTATALAGTFTLTGTTSLPNGTMMIAVHRNADGSYDTATGTVINGIYSMPLSVTGQSPFMVFALVEQPEIEIPVTVIPTDGGSPQTGDSSNMRLWIALLFISGGAIGTIGITRKKRRERN